MMRMTKMKMPNDQGPMTAGGKLHALRLVQLSLGHWSFRYTK